MKIQKNLTYDDKNYLCTIIKIKHKDHIPLISLSHYNNDDHYILDQIEIGYNFLHTLTTKVVRDGFEYTGYLKINGDVWQKLDDYRDDQINKLL